MEAVPCGARLRKGVRVSAAAPATGAAARAAATAPGFRVLGPAFRRLVRRSGRFHDYLLPL